jgi:hypothetical protein
MRPEFGSALKGSDPWAYGLTKANRKNLETVLHPMSRA